MASSDWLDIDGDVAIHRAVLNVLPKDTIIHSAVRSGISAWTKTAKIEATLADGSSARYFLKAITGKGSKALVEGEFHSAQNINSVVPGLIPEPKAWGRYETQGEEFYFYLQQFRDMEVAAAPDPNHFIHKIAQMHENGKSPNGKFGYPVPTVIGKMQRTVTWEETWAASFTHQIKDVIMYDNDTNGPWPELALACSQLIDVIIPRLLGVLQSDGREITPSLIHGSLWENNIGIDMETGNTIIYDPGCTYSHNEMEFGTWRCSWASHFKSPVYMRLYQRLIEPSEPAEEWDDRNRLYSLHPYFVDSAGHPGSISRQLAYNDILYLCEKYGPLDTLEKYDPEKDIAVTGGHIPFVISQLE